MSVPRLPPCQHRRPKDRRTMGCAALPIVLRIGDPNSPCLTCEARVEPPPKGKGGSQAVRPVEPPKAILEAPVVADPEARLEICETECDQWIGERCAVPCGCRNRPRPLAESGRDCPRGLWRRSSGS